MVPGECAWWILEISPRVAGNQERQGLLTWPQGPTERGTRGPLGRLPTSSGKHPFLGWRSGWAAHGLGRASASWDQKPKHMPEPL